MPLNVMSCEDKPDEDPRPATRPTMSTQTNMYQGEDRIWTDFQNLLARTHVQHAIYESASDYNEIPTSLADVVLLGGYPSHLSALYNARLSSHRPLTPWRLSPGPIRDRDTHLGDPQYQRAFTDYYSLELNNRGGNADAMAVSHILHRQDLTQTFMHGLFGGFGRSLIFLGHGFEVNHALMVVQGLTLGSVDWNKGIHDLLVDCTSYVEEDVWPREAGAVLNDIGLDGRFSGTGGLGIGNVSQLLKSSTRRAAIVRHVRALDIPEENIYAVLNQLSLLATMLACLTHKPNRPAYDVYLARLPALVMAVRVLLNRFDGSFESMAQKTTMVRGVWMLIVLAYITQLRPVLDKGLIRDREHDWDEILEGFRKCEFKTSFRASCKYIDGQFLMTLRSIYNLSQYETAEQEVWYRHCAWNLVTQWRRWTGYGRAGEESLNIRL